MGLRQKPIQEYRPSEEPMAAPATNAGEGAELKDVLQAAETENTLQAKLALLRYEIQDAELSRYALTQTIEAYNTAKGELDEIMKAFYAAKDSANNIVDGIVAQIVRVEKTRFTAHLDEESVTQVQNTNHIAIEHERTVLAQHRKDEEAMLHKHTKQMAEIVRRGEGVWMSQRVFYIIAPIAFFSILAWVIYLSFWVYFKWIA